MLREAGRASGYLVRLRNGPSYEFIYPPAVWGSQVPDP